MPERSQSASYLLMVRPPGFGRNHEAAETNAFMRSREDVDLEGEDRISRVALAEFDTTLQCIKGAGVRVIVRDDTKYLPDSVFPNNWFSWHLDRDLVEGMNKVTTITYPMLSPLRRRERDIEMIRGVADELGITMRRELTLVPHEDAGRFLEGTGSLVLDRVRGLAFACRSPRTDEELVRAFCDLMGYEPVVFDAVATGLKGQGPTPVYHTNVMMNICETFSIWCPALIADAAQRKMVAEKLRHDRRTLVEIEPEQVAKFAGNILQVRTWSGRYAVAGSSTAWDCLSRDQVRAIILPNQPRRPDGSDQCIQVICSIPTIERVGGGSVRCMLAEIDVG